MDHPLHQHFRQTWKDVSRPWLDWGDKVAHQSRAATQWILELATPTRGMRVLDLASGVADPALSLARCVEPGGHVLATDVVEDALVQLAHNARARGLHALTTQTMAMEHLTLRDGAFDVVTCRLGLMFSVDLEATLAAVHRVLKPGGHFCAVAWGTPGQPLFAATLAALPGFRMHTMDSQDRPGPFRFAQAGTLTSALQRAGFKAVHEETRQVPWPWPGPPQEMWRAFVELSGPELWSGLDPAVEARVLENLEAFKMADGVDTGAHLVGAVAQR